MKKTLLVASCALMASVTALAFSPKNLGPQVNTMYPHVMAREKTVTPMKSVTRAGEPTMEFGYAGSPYSAYALNGPVRTNIIYEAFQIPVADIASFSGVKVKAINIYAPSDYYGDMNPVKSGTAFISTNINSASGIVAEQAFTFEGVAMGLNTIEFDEPYTIDGTTSLYVGYYFTLPNSSTYYLVVDGATTSSSTLNNLVGITNKEGSYPSSFANYSDQIGSLCISLTLEGENLPKDIAVIKGLDVDTYYPASSKLNYTLTVRNAGANAVESLEVKTTTTAGTDYTKTISLTTPIEPNTEAEVSVTNIPNEKEGIYNLSSSITKVNGKAVENPVVYTGEYSTYGDGYPRNLVMEEATGTWCGWCPAGIVMMEYIKEKYDDRWFRIGVHNGDPMALSTYQAFIQEYVGGFPDAWCNRYYEVPPTASGVLPYCDALYNYLTSYPAYAQVSFNGELDEIEKTVTLNATTRFVFDLTGKQYSLSFVAVEDGVGPFNQSNYYSPDSPNCPGTAMDGWEKLGTSVSTIYDDVARAINAYPGIANSIPATIEKGKDYTYSTTLDLSKITKDEFRIIALITNDATGEIINANQITMHRSGVNNIAEESVEVVGGKGAISVKGASNVAVYSLDGRRVNADNLSHGVYVVVADGKSYKVAVK